MLLTFPSCWWTLRLYIITIPSRTSRREFSVMGWSGSSGGLPSRRPSFPWLPSTAMHPQDRREVLSKAFWHLSFCPHLSEAKALLCLCNTVLLPSACDSPDALIHHSHLTACIRLTCQICSNRPRPCKSHFLEPCTCFRGLPGPTQQQWCCYCTCHPPAGLCSEQAWLQLALNYLPAKSRCTCRNQGSISLHAEGDSITSVMFRMAKWLTADLWASACPGNGKEQCWQ